MDMSRGSRVATLAGGRGPKGRAKGFPSAFRVHVTAWVDGYYVGPDTSHRCKTRAVLALPATTPASGGRPSISRIRNGWPAPTLKKVRLARRVT